MIEVDRRREKRGTDGFQTLMTLYFGQRDSSHILLSLCLSVCLSFWTRLREKLPCERSNWSLVERMPHYFSMFWLHWNQRCPSHNHDPLQRKYTSALWKHAICVSLGNWLIHNMGSVSYGNITQNLKWVFLNCWVPTQKWVTGQEKTKARCK